MAANARRKVEMYFDWDGVFVQLMARYTLLLARAAPTAAPVEQVCISD